MKYLFVINPISGGLDKTSTLMSIESSFEDYLIYYTKGENDRRLLSSSIKECQPDVLVAVGGDGTILLCSEVLMGLEGKILLGILPVGSANGMAKELHIPEDIDYAVQILKAHDHEVPLDLIEVNKKFHCLHIGDAGLNARIVRDYAEDGERGYFTYAKYFFEELKKATPFVSSIIADGKEYEFEGYMLAISNAMRYGTGVKVNYISNPSDGKFELSCLSDIGIGTFVKAGLSALDIDLAHEGNQQIISCKKAKVKFNRPVTFQVDGELIGKVREFEAEIIEKAVTVITKRLI